MADERKETLIAESVVCGKCAKTVGLLWYKGRSTLFEGPIDTDGEGNLVVTRHNCDRPKRGDSYQPERGRPPRRK